MRLGRVLGTVVVVVAAAGCSVLGDDRTAYDSRLVKYDNDEGEPNRYVNLDDGAAQFSIGSPDGHRIVVQWRDPDGSGWTAPETVWTDEENLAVDNTVRYGGGTVGVIQTFSPDVHNDSDVDDVHVAIVCRAGECDVGDSPGYVGEAQVTPDGRWAYVGQDERGVVLWTPDKGIHRADWSGHPGFGRRVEASMPLLAPDGSLHVVSSTRAGDSCTFALLGAAPGTADLEQVGRTTRPVRGGCRTYLETYSSDWVQVSSSNPKGSTFWFVREGDAWTVTDEDPSGLVLVEDRGRRRCCDTFLAGFIHWNDVAYGSPDGHRVVIQSHLLGDERWSDPVVLDGAPRDHTCTWMDGYEVGDAGYAVTLVCHSGTVRDDYVGDAYVVAASPDLATWEARFVTGVRQPPDVQDDRIVVGDLAWSPDEGFVTR